MRNSSTGSDAKTADKNPSEMPAETAPKTTSVVAIMLDNPSKTSRNSFILGAVALGSFYTNGKQNAESCCFTRFSINPNAAIVRLHQGFGDGQANAAISNALDERMICPVTA